MDQDTTYVAFDTSKETLAVGIAKGGRRREVRFFGTIASRPEAAQAGGEAGKTASSAGLLLRGRAHRLRALPPDPCDGL